MKRYTLLWNLVLILSFTSIQAAEHVWTGVGSPCGDTLNLCNNNATENDTIIIKTNEVINESLNYADVSVSLVAAEGYRPVFGVGQNIQLKNNSGEIRIVGLTLLDGNITVVNEVNSGAGSRIEISRNHVAQHAGDAINIYQKGVDDLLEIDVKYNQIAVTGSNSVGIRLKTQEVGNHLWDATVYGNTIVGEAVTWGVFVESNDSVGTFTNLISGNVLLGHTRAAIALWNQDDSTAEMTSYIVSNYAKAGDILAVAQLATGGQMIVHVYNNTIIDSDTGISMLGQLGGELMEYHLVNNLIIDANVGVHTNPPSHNIMVTNETNMFQRVGSHTNYAVSGTNILVADHVAVVQSGLSPRLVAGSPAIDAATFVTAGPYVDADGLYRSKLGGIDIGAFEYGDHTFLHTSSGGGYNSPMSDESVNGQSTSDSIHITQNASPAILYNLANTGIWYSGGSGNWNIFNQDLSTEIESGVKFNVIHMGNSVNTFEHTASGGAWAFTYLNKAQLNDDPDKVLQVTQHWTGFYNNHPEGIYYNEGLGNWYIYNLDNEAIPDGANYNVQYQDASKSAWVHTATDDNTGFSYTVLDNALINNVPCAQIQVTQKAVDGAFNAHPVAVEYSLGIDRWLILQQVENGGIITIPSMPIGAEFHVLINPQQIEQCTDLIFANSFD